MSYNEFIAETKLIRATDISPDNPPNLGIRIEVIADPDPLDPRKEFDHVATMVCWHRNYNLGDEQPDCDPKEYLAALADKHDPCLSERIDRARDHFYGRGGWLTKVELIYDARHAKALEPYVFKPLTLHDHGTISIQTGYGSDPWDSGQLGFIYVSKADAIEKYGISSYEPSFIKLIEKRLDDEVSEYDDYLTGQCFGFILTEIHINEDGDEVEQGELDSCWGFLGDDKYAMEEAESQVEFYMGRIVKRYLAEHGEAHRQLELAI